VQGNARACHPIRSPLVIRQKDLNWALKRIKAVFKRLA
jgi:hypothetical protein